MKGAAKPIHSPTEIQKDLQQAGTSVSKDTISRNLHRKDLHSRSKETRVNARLSVASIYPDVFNFCSIWSKYRWLIFIHFNKFQASIHTSLFRSTMQIFTVKVSTDRVFADFSRLFEKNPSQLQYLRESWKKYLLSIYTAKLTKV